MMRKLGLIGSLGLVALFATILACAVEPTTESHKTTSDDSTATTVEVPSPVEEATAAAPDDIAPNAVNCSIVDFCDVPGTSVGTRCVQKGCTFNQAVAECISELPDGCSLKCPAVMRTSSGDKVFRLHCGGAAGSCCPANTQYCGPTGTCCDGIHFNSLCPPL